MGHLSFFRVFQAHLSRRITAWVFGSLLVVESAILLPSYLKREQDLLAIHHEKVMIGFNAALLASVGIETSNSLDNDQIDRIGRVLEDLRSQSIILGYAIYQADQPPLLSNGHLPQGLAPVSTQVQDWEALLHTPQLHRRHHTYDRAVRVDALQPTHYLVIRHHTETIQQALNAYVVRMILMIILIAAVVTLGTMVGIERVLLRSLIYLHQDLLTAASNIRQGMRDIDFQTQTSKPRDELGEVIATFHGMYLQIWQAMDARDAANMSEQYERQRADQLHETLTQLHKIQVQLIQAEKMASLGQLVAGIGHEINNPLGFLKGSIHNAKDYVQDLLDHIALYEQYSPDMVEPVQKNADRIDLAFLCEDFPTLLNSMEGATDKIETISTSLRIFSRADTNQTVKSNLHEGLDSTILLLKYRLKANNQRPEIQVIRDYGELPLVDCFPGQLNQVFMNILANAVDMFDDMVQTMSFAEVENSPQQITIQTRLLPEQNAITIRILDNGMGMPEAIQTQIFDHLFTTKGVGRGTGLGLEIARQIVVEKHHGTLDVSSTLNQGSEFFIQLPLQTDTSS